VTQVVALIGSPRRLGNSELMAKEISRHISEPHHLQLVRLPALNIKPCRACYTCLFDKKGCPQDDDFGKILAALLEADGLILSAPAYFLSANASVKKFLDRGLAFYPEFDRLWGKPAVAVTVAGIPGMEGYTKLCLESACRAMGTELKGSEVVYGALPGEVFMNEDNRQAAESLAGALFAAPPDWQNVAWRCGACGGDTFRFLGPDQVRCMTCSSSGKVLLDGGHLEFSVQAPENHFFLTLEGALHHRDWLRGMKKRFIEKKDVLKSICVDYRKDGDWLKSHHNEKTARK
jgi:multimeric flavodoxin WrbA